MSFPVSKAENTIWTIYLIFQFIFSEHISGFNKAPKETYYNRFYFAFL